MTNSPKLEAALAKGRNIPGDKEIYEGDDGEIYMRYGVLLSKANFCGTSTDGKPYVIGWTVVERFEES